MSYQQVSADRGRNKTRDMATHRMVYALEDNEGTGWIMEQRVKDIKKNSTEKGMRETVRQSDIETETERHRETLYTKLNDEASASGN